MIEIENVAYSNGSGELLSDISTKLALRSINFLNDSSGTDKTRHLKLSYGVLQLISGQVWAMGNGVCNLYCDGAALVVTHISSRRALEARF